MINPTTQNPVYSRYRTTSIFTLFKLCFQLHFFKGLAQTERVRTHCFYNVGYIFFLGCQVDQFTRDFTCRVIILMTTRGHLLSSVPTGWINSKPGEVLVLLLWGEFSKVRSWDAMNNKLIFKLQAKAFKHNRSCCTHDCKVKNYIYGFKVWLPFQWSPLMCKTTH